MDQPFDVCLLPSLYNRRALEEDFRRQQADSRGLPISAHLASLNYDEEDAVDFHHLRRYNFDDVDFERGHLPTRGRRSTSPVFYGPEPQPNYVSLVTRHVFLSLFDMFNVDAIAGLDDSGLRLPLTVKLYSGLLWLLALAPSIALFAYGLASFRSCNRAEPLLPLWLIVSSLILGIYTMTSAVCFYCTDRVAVVILFAFRILAVMLYIIWAFAGLFFVLILAGAFGVPHASDDADGFNATVLAVTAAQTTTTENFDDLLTTKLPLRRRYATDFHVYKALRQCEVSAVYVMATVTAVATVPLLFYAGQQCYWCITFLCWFDT